MLPKLLSKLNIWYIGMDNATYQGMVITIQVAVSVFDFLFFPKPKQVCCLGQKQSDRKRTEYVTHRYNSECCKQTLLPIATKGIQYRTET